MIEIYEMQTNPSLPLSSTFKLQKEATKSRSLKNNCVFSYPFIDSCDEEICVVPEHFLNRRPVHKDHREQRFQQYDWLQCDF